MPVFPYIGAVGVLPDVEAIVSAFLRQNPDVVALIGQKVYGELPTKMEPDYPVVLVTRLAGTPTVNTNVGLPVLDAALVQLDVWGGTKAQARTIAATCQAALVGLSSYSTVVTGIRLGSLGYQSDRDLSPPRPRYYCECTIFARS